MPLHDLGGGCWRWGNHGARYCGPGAREKAMKQMKAIFHSGYTGAEENLDKLIEVLADSDVQSLHFDKNKFSSNDAKAWASEHGFTPDFIKIKEDIILTQHPAKTNAEFSVIELCEGVTALVEGEAASNLNKYFKSEALKLKTGDRTEVSTETTRMDDGRKPTVDDLAEVRFLLYKGQFSKESAKEWMKVHHFAKTYKTIPPNFTVTLVEDGEFWRYDNLPEKDFSKFKTVSYDDGVTVILGII